ncbi:hypothetical protein OAC41_05670 [Acidimicrobiales bacterium]|nr:hypothetical protein [Acidimicrobiales bacterium]
MTYTEPDDDTMSPDEPDFLGICNASATFLGPDEHVGWPHLGRVHFVEYAPASGAFMVRYNIEQAGPNEYLELAWVGFPEGPRLLAIEVGTCDPTTTSERGS